MVGVYVQLCGVGEVGVRVDVGWLHEFKWFPFPSE